MKQKKLSRKEKKVAKADSIGIFNAISKKEKSFFEKEDNSLWWTLGLLLMKAGLVSIWAFTSFLEKN
jgi:hypothetical protein